MTNSIDGFSFDQPLRETQIIALAQYHRKQLHDAVFHQEVHLGNFCIAQRNRVYDYTQHLDPMQKKDFYRIYDGELKRLDTDDLHPVAEESALSIFTVVLVLVLIAAMLYFAVLHIMFKS
ncbi:hypothetical protein [Acinetobacter rudis]|uniref:Uncharacterized protein n=1 Tax=Acinetobacter rudis CIP 110305 TaxID=421052 RepID=S3NCC1_9GAMM|nr:hypothetical protein [Acinetobacter rudis]EPF72004.1 hypothetical protein F945_02350 [Acinetobacter rudis CIP 110305]